MRLERLDLNLLVALDVLLRVKNVSIAARTLNLSQSTMSGALSRLRTYFGDRLLVPVGRRLALTPLAEQLSVSVRDAIILIQSRIITPSQFDPTTSTRCFKIVASDYAHQVFLADALRWAASEAPGCSFEIVPIHMAALDEFEHGDIDLFFTVADFTDTHHPMKVLFDDRAVCICWKMNRRVGATLDYETFIELPHAETFFGRGDAAAYTERLFIGKGINLRVAIKVHSFSALPAAIIGTERLAMMNSFQAQYFAKYHPIRILPLPVETPPVQEVVQWHRMRKRDEGIQWLLRHCTAASERLGDRREHKTGTVKRRSDAVKIRRGRSK